MNNHDEMKLKIHVLVKTSALKMGFPEPTAFFCDGVYEECSKFGIANIEHSLHSFMKEDLRGFPKLGQIISRLAFFNKRDLEKKSQESGEGICSYYDKNETEFSRSQCHKKVIYEWSEFSKKYYGGIFCNHHCRRMNALNSPDHPSSRDFRAQMRHGEAMRLKAIEVGITDDKFKDFFEYLDSYFRYVEERPDIANLLPFSNRDSPLNAIRGIKS